MVSTSLVTRESTSPTLLESKYLRGSKLIFLEIARRSPCEFFCVTVAMMTPCKYEQSNPTE